MIVLDASALIAFLLDEVGKERVRDRLKGSCMSALNYSEVLSRFAKDGVDIQALGQMIRRSGIEIVPFAAKEALTAAELLISTAHLGLSLGDRACLALAQNRGLHALTADRIWTRLEVGIEIECIR
ncbi:unnamed protein product [Phaeothamnion confervicola]